MPRTARLTHPGGFYHLYNRSLGKREIFKEPKDYHKVLSKLEDILKESDYTIYAYCFMPTHFHLMVEETKTPIIKLMSRLLTSYAVYFNKKYSSAGPLFAGRYKSILTLRDGGRKD